MGSTQGKEIGDSFSVDQISKTRIVGQLRDEARPYPNHRSHFWSQEIIPTTNMQKSSLKVKRGVMLRVALPISSVQSSHSVVSNCLRPHGLQHTRHPCPLPTPRACSNSSIALVMLSNHLILCHPLLLPPSIFPRIRVFSKSQLFTSGGQSIGPSTSASVLSMNIQYWSPLGWTGWISSQSKGLSRVFSNTTFQKHQFFSAQLSL